MATEVAGEVGRPPESFGAQGAGVGPEARVAQPVSRQVVREAEEATTGGAGQGCPRGSSTPSATATASTTATATASASATVRWAALGRWRGLWIHACGEKAGRQGWGEEMKDVGVVERRGEREEGRSSVQKRRQGRGRGGRG